MKLFLSLFLFLIFSLTALAQTAAVTVEGQVVCCADCWAEADRTRVEYGTAEDLLKAKSCVEGGDPTLLAVREGDRFTLYRLEQGKFKLSEKNWLSYVGKKVSVTGTKRKIKKADAFVVDALTVVAPSIAEREARAAVGKEVELNLKDLFGADVSLAQYKNRIVILNFWATFCEPCRKEMPDLAAIQNEYAALGLQVIGASTDDVANRAKVMQFIRETKVNFPIWTGATAADMKRFGLGEALPGTVVIDRSGKIAKVISGVVNVADLRKQIDSMLQTAENDLPQPETIATTGDEKKAEPQPRQQQASSVPS
ncbi:MAG: TlpA family protein disulfide reductase [Acidobacteriota bacterium]|nr:TlpA family protein disulfide reductase [Acidobacteriota bacterium]